MSRKFSDHPIPGPNARLCSVHSVTDDFQFVLESHDLRDLLRQIRAVAFVSIVALKDDVFVRLSLEVQERNRLQNDTQHDGTRVSREILMPRVSYSRVIHVTSYS